MKLTDKFYVERKCENCGRVFYVPKKKARGKKMLRNEIVRMMTSVTCSMKCSKARIDRKQKERRRAHIHKQGNCNSDVAERVRS
jgi:hypothetical protein